MTVAELLEELQAALDRGLPPETTVTIYNGHIDDYEILDGVDDPSSPSEGCELWFTLFPGEVATYHSTPGGLAPLPAEWHDMVVASVFAADARYAERHNLT